MSKPNLLQKLAITGVAGTISAIGFGIANSSAQAAVITNGCTAANVFCTLGELNNGGTIQVGDKLFSEWDVIEALKSQKLEVKSQKFHLFLKRRGFKID